MATTSHPPDRGPAVFIVTTTTIIIASIFVTVRMLSRCLVVKKTSWDDYLMILALLFAFLMSFSIDVGTKKGLGQHDVDRKPEWEADLRRSVYAFSVLYEPALMATKSSILIFYLRLSRNTKQLLRIASYITLAVVVTAGIVLTFLCIFQCRPVSAAFTTSTENANCFGLVTLYLTSAPVNIITDLAILVLPIPVLTSMRLPQKQKNILIVTFGLGAFVTIVDVVRIYYLQEASMDTWTGSVTNARIGVSVDFAWNASYSLMWTAVEVNVGIICACVPTLKPLISRLKPHWIGHVRTRSDRASTSQPHSFTANQTSGGLLVDSGVYTTQSKLAAGPASCGQRFHLQSPTHGIENQLSLEDRDGSAPGMELADILSEPQMARMSLADTPLQSGGTVNSSVYFGFVKMGRPKSMLKTRGKESFGYCAMVTILFFLWGFSHGLINVLSTQIALLARESVIETLGLDAAYFGSYLFGPILGCYVLKKGSFKATFVTGLCIYGVGTLMFWPSAVLQSFPGFFVSNFVVGFGLSILETAAHPFICLCGSQRYSEFRLLLAQAVQGVGGVVAPMLAEKVFFRPDQKVVSLVDVQYAYLAIALFDVILALFFYYMPLPEATDTDLDKYISKAPPPSNSQPGAGSKFYNKYSVVLTTLAFGTASQFFYASVHEGIAIYLEVLLNAIKTPSSPPLITSHNFSLIAQTLFAVSRFLFAGFTLIIPPRILLLVAFIASFIFTIVMVALPVLNTINTNTIAAASLLVFFFKGPIFPIIFAISIRGLGRRTKAGGALLTASISGAGFFPFLMYAAAGKVPTYHSTRHAFIIVAGFFGMGTLYPIYLNFVPKVRKQVDSPPRPGKAAARDVAAGNPIGRRAQGVLSGLVDGIGNRVDSMNGKATEPGHGDKEKLDE